MKQEQIMKLFITGATGFIGGAVARAAISAGHQVTALVRSRTSGPAAALSGIGVALHAGDLREPQSFSASAGTADAVVHAASTNDASAGAVDEAAAIAMLAALPAGAAFIHTSGAWVYGDTRGTSATEASALNPPLLVAWRPEVERKVLALAAECAVAAVVLRPAMVHGNGGGVFGMLAGMARQSGVVQVVGTGHNHWPTVHVDDLAAAYIAAVERAKDGQRGIAGRILNIVAEEAVPVAAIADAVRLAVGADRIEVVPLESARQTMGPFADALALDQGMSGQSARQFLGWKAGRPGVLADLPSRMPR
jgi:nucleoside-diphosphate-sugar epimerase